MQRPKREGVMLAYPADEGRVRRLGNRFFAQRKYRGDRAVTEWAGSEPVLLSSYGNHFRYLDHIKKGLKSFKNVFVDGEIYKHGWSQQQINSVALREVNRHPEVEELEYHIFDIKWPENSFHFRLMYLLKFQAEGYFKPPIFLAETVITDINTWLPLMNQWVNEGYEGIILRNAISLYEEKRSVGLLKCKPTEEDEYEIVGVNEAISQEGEPKAMVGSFTVRDNEGIEFDVGAGKMTFSERNGYWRRRGELLNQILVVKHEPEFSKKGVPSCAVAVKIKMNILKQ